MSTAITATFYVTFSGVREAQSAYAGLNNCILDNMIIKTSTENEMLIIEGARWDWSHSAIHNLASKYGVVRTIRKSPNDIRWVFSVVFEESEDALKACKALHGYMLSGYRRLNVALDMNDTTLLVKCVEQVTPEEMNNAFARFGPLVKLDMIFSDSVPKIANDPDIRRFSGDDSDVLRSIAERALPGGLLSREVYTSKNSDNKKTLTGLVTSVQVVGNMQICAINFGSNDAAHRANRLLDSTIQVADIAADNL